MRFLKSALIFALLILTMNFVASAQTPRSTEDPRNTAPTVGTGGPVGGPTGLFTVYDGQTLRRGEFTFSAAYSNYDRDPGNVDIDEIPVSFQIGLNDYVELFFSTDAYKSYKVNSPANLSGFYLPNSRLNGISPAAFVLAPQGAGTSQFANQGILRPAGSQPFVQYPYVGASAGAFGFGAAGQGTVFGFPAGTTPTIGVRTSSGNGADTFPGIGSPVGGILPGVVLQTGTVAAVNNTQLPVTVATTFTSAPSYLPEAPFLNRQFGESSFSTYNVGAKIRFTGANNPVGVGVIPYYVFYNDNADDFSGFNQLQRGASPGSKRGDFGLVLFSDARLSKYVNLSGNVGYKYTSSVKAKINGTKYTLLDRGDELSGGLGVDVTPNKYFQAIGEFTSLRYVGGRTPNAFQQNPLDLLGGIRIFPTRYFSIGGAYRYNLNQQDAGSFKDNTKNGTIAYNRVAANGASTTTTFNTTGPNGVPNGFVTSNDPNGFIASISLGRRDARKEPGVINTPAIINSIDLSKSEISLPCPAGLTSASGACPDNSSTVNVTTNASDVNGDTLLYNYTVSGGQITGTGANVTWDLAGAKPGTYTLSVGVDDGCGVCGTPSTKEIRVVECADCKPPAPVCPTDIAVTATPELIQVNETATFTASATLNGTSPTFNWTVSGGEIVSGQGTNSIVVKATPDLAGQTITATGMLGNIDPTCQNSASATINVGKPAIATLIDEYGVEKANRSKARLDNFAVALQNDPTARGLVIGYGSGKNAARTSKARIAFAIKYLTQNRGVDAGRLDTVDGGVSSADRTQLYLVPAGAVAPTPLP